MAEPRDWAERRERNHALPQVNADQFAGYGVIGLPFASGHVLALRRFAASSIGPGYTTVWHRSPGGEWTFYSDVSPLQSCSRYFADKTARTLLTSIQLTWTADRTLAINVTAKPVLDWGLTLATTPTTRLFNARGSAIPEAAWRQRLFLALLGRLAGVALRTGRMRLHGQTPNRQWFDLSPRRIWLVRDSRACLGSEELGPPGPLARQAHLADSWLPQRGLFAVGRASFETPGATRQSMIQPY